MSGLPKYFKTRPRFLTDLKFQRKIIKKLRNKDRKINASVAERSKAAAL